MNNMIFNSQKLEAVPESCSTKKAFGIYGNKDHLSTDFVNFKLVAKKEICFQIKPYLGLSLNLP